MTRLWTWLTTRHCDTCGNRHSHRLLNSPSWCLAHAVAHQDLDSLLRQDDR